MTTNLQVTAQSVVKNVSSVLPGKEQAIELVIATVISGGHVLLDDKPGTGKTTLAKAIAQSLGGVTRRIQCTPDLTPGDVLGGRSVCTSDEWLQMTTEVRKVSIHPDVQAFIVDVIRAIRQHLGATAQLSPRAALWLQRIAQSLTWLRGEKDYVTPDVIMETIPYVLIHRCTGSGLSIEQLKSAMINVKVPT